MNMVRQPLHEAMTGAKMVGIKAGVGDSTIFGCWFGGYGFNVYDSHGNEVNHFTSGELAGDVSDDNKRRLAQERLESEGFEVLR